MALANLTFAWFWFLAGVASGAIQGLWFHRDGWLGGYDSWPRRMTRLGHIAFFGTGLLNLSFGLTVLAASLTGTAITVASVLMIVGAVGMPLVCYLSAWRKPLRHLFAIPVLALGSGIGTCAVVLAQHSMTQPSIGGA